MTGGEKRPCAGSTDEPVDKSGSEWSVVTEWAVATAMTTLLLMVPVLSTLAFQHGAISVAGVDRFDLLVAVPMVPGLALGALGVASALWDGRADRSTGQ